MKQESPQSIMEKFYADPKIPLEVRERELEIYKGAEKSELLAIGFSLGSAFAGVAIDKPAVAAVTSVVVMGGVGIAALAGYYMERTSRNLQKQYNIR